MLNSPDSSDVSEGASCPVIAIPKALGRSNLGGCGRKAGTRIEIASYLAMTAQAIASPVHFVRVAPEKNMKVTLIY